MFFSCINICWVPRKLFEHEAVRPFKHLPGDLASVNAMKQTCREGSSWVEPVQSLDYCVLLKDNAVTQ